MDNKENNGTINDKIDSFNKMLDGLNILDKKRELWKEIYAHALQDRQYALQMYISCSNLVIGDPLQHAIHGPNISKYLERMSKSNDQLIKLAELIAVAEELVEEGKTMSADEIYASLATDAEVIPLATKKSKK